MNLCYAMDIVTCFMVSISVSISSQKGLSGIYFLLLMLDLSICLLVDFISLVPCSCIEDFGSLLEAYHCITVVCQSLIFVFR
jgi:hypothetical protein